MNNSVPADDGDNRRGQNQTLQPDLPLRGSTVIRKQEQSADGAEHKHADSPSHQPFLNRFSVVANIFVGIALVVVGSLQFGVYSRQAKIMKTQTGLIRNQDQLLKDANDLTTAIQRPFVYFDKMNYAFYENSATPSKRDLAITIEWGNSGNTPTKHLTHQVGWLISDAAVAEPFELIPWADTSLLPDVFGPKTTNLAGTCDIAAATIARVNTRQTHLYICGIARYGDIFDTEAKHVTEFCYEITRIDPSNVARNLANTVGQHNCADKDCP